MNNLRTHNKAILSRLLLGMALFGHSLYGITVNHIPLEQIIKQDQLLAYICQEQDNVTLFEIQNGNINLSSENIENLQNLKEKFEDLQDKTIPLKSTKSFVFEGGTVSFGGRYLMSKEYIKLQAKTSLRIVDCLLESPILKIKGNQINFGDCFLINPQPLDIFSNSPESNIQSIRIIFHEESTYPTVITGEIDLENNQTSRTLMITNVKKIEIIFSQKVWEN